MPHAGAVKIKSITVVHRFWDKVDKNGPILNVDLGNCWVWTGARDEDGYGVWREKDNGPTKRAHRHSYELAYGPVPDGEFVMHKCDNPPCVRAAHLGHGTNADNLRDMADKGRARGGRRTKDGKEPRNRR